MIRLISALAGMAMLSACATPAVIGHCELPTALAVHSTPLDAVTPGMSLADQHAQWAKDRAHAAQSDAHSDALIDYVGKNCQ